MQQRMVMASPVGQLAIYTRDGMITRLDYGARGTPGGEDVSPLHKKIKKQLLAYFSRAATRFDLPLDLQGTEFQQQVWRALRAIPVSETLSYGELADKLHTSPRAVGNACRANPVPLIVPCHRVVARHGIGGFSGATSGGPVARKRWLLQHEGAL